MKITYVIIFINLIIFFVAIHYQNHHKNSLQIIKNKIKKCNLTNCDIIELNRLFDDFIDDHNYYEDDLDFLYI